MKVDSLPGVEVSVRMNGDVLTEHIDDGIEQEADSATCYVAVTSGSPFNIEVKVPRSTRLKGDELFFDATIDGQKIRGKAWFNKKTLREGPDRGCPTVTGMLNGHRSIDGIQEFEFGDVTIEEGDASEKRTPGVDKLGQIVIRAQHAKFNGQGPPKTRRPPVTHSQTINEKTIKGQAISHQVKFTNPKPEARYDGPRSKYKRMHNQPTTTYVFNYRSKEALQSLMILPRTPTSSPPAQVPRLNHGTSAQHPLDITSDTAAQRNTPSAGASARTSSNTAQSNHQARATPAPNPLLDRDPSTLSPAEMLEYIRQLQAQNATLTASANVKREIKDEDDEEERDPEAYRRRMKKRAKLSAMDVIDVDALD